MWLTKEEIKLGFAELLEVDTWATLGALAAVTAMVAVIYVVVNG
jgi:hypothetical protein